MDSKTALACALRDALNHAGNNLPMEVEQRCRRVLDLHGACPSLQELRKQRHDQSNPCDI